MTNEQIAQIAHEIWCQHSDSAPWGELTEEARKAKIERVENHMERLARGEDVIKSLTDSPSAEKVEDYIIAHVVKQLLEGKEAA